MSLTHGDQRVTEADIRAVLADTYTPEGIDVWLASANRNLGYLSPRQCLAMADNRYVLVEAERMAGAM